MQCVTGDSKQRQKLVKLDTTRARYQPRSMIMIADSSNCRLSYPDHISLQYVDAMMRFVAVCNQLCVGHPTT